MVFDDRPSGPRLRVRGVRGDNSLVCRASAGRVLSSSGSREISSVLWETES